MRGIVLLLLVCIFNLSNANTPGGKEENKQFVETFEILVIDADSEEAIPAAQIKINEKELKAYTDFDGLAEFKNVPNGIYDIEISLVSYQKAHLKAYKIDQNNHQLVIKLNP